MTRFGPRIEPITSPTPGGCANSYATDAGFPRTKMDADATEPIKSVGRSSRLTGQMY